MSDSGRTDTQRIFRNLTVIALTFMVSLSAQVTLAQTAEPTAPAPTAPAPTAPAPTATEPTAPPTAPNSVGLLDGLSGLDLSKLLGTVLPNEIVMSAGLDRNPFSAALFDLIQYMRNNVDTRTPDDVLAGLPKYRRVEMFGTWVNENAPQDCYNTRAEVLLRDLDGKVKVSFTAANPCIVSKGEWHDPYSGKDFKLASAVQVDHVVPLKNAYRSGAHAWTRERRCHYANYLDDSMHLLSVSGHENMAKGDSGPEAYLPPDEGYVCEYIANWMRIKASWNLTFSSEEQAAIEKELRDHNCAVAGTRPPLSSIQKNRKSSSRQNEKCLLPQ